MRKIVLIVSFFLVAEIGPLAWAGEIHVAVRAGDIHKVRALLRENRSLVNAQDEQEGATPLHWAASRGELSTPSLIVRDWPRQASRDEANSFVPHNPEIDNQIIKLLLANGADVNSWDKRGDSPIHWAAGAGNLAGVKILVAHHGDVNDRDFDGYTPLHFAALVGDQELLAFLLSKGSQLNAQNIVRHEHYSPVDMAIFGRNLATTEFLLSRGAKLAGNIGFYLQFYQEAQTQKEKEIINLLLAHGIQTGNPFGPCPESASSAGRPNENLFEAVRNNNLVMIRSLLAENPQLVNAKDYFDKTPLHWAASFGNQIIIKYLLSKGADISALDSDGETPLHLAAKKDNVAIMALLISKAGHTTIDISNLLFAAVEGGPAEMVEYLLKLGADVNARKKDGDTPLHVCACRFNDEKFNLLLTHGADINARNNMGQTPLLLAASCWQGTNHAPLLMERGAEVNARDHGGFTPLIAGASFGSPNALKYLLEHGAEIDESSSRGFTALHIAAWRGNTENVQLLLEFGADLNATNIEDKTPLHLAAEGGHEWCPEDGYGRENWNAVKLMLDHGANVNALDKKGNTPLAIATAQRKYDLMKLLHSRGGQGGEIYWAIDTQNVKDVKKLIRKNHQLVFALTNHSQTLLHRAAETGNLEIARMLLKKGLKAGICDEFGATPLHFAVLGGNPTLVTLLLENGADPNSQGGNWEEREIYEGKLSPLHLAVRSGNAELVTLLLAGGAKVNSRDSDDMIPLHYAAKQGNTEIVKILVSNNSEVNAKNNWGATPLSLAPCSNQDLIALLRQAGGIE